MNASSEPLNTQIDLNDARKLSGSGKAIVLTSTSPLDENTLEEPLKVSPKIETVEVSGTTIARLLPGNSFTVICITTYSGKNKYLYGKVLGICRIPVFARTRKGQNARMTPKASCH